MKRIGPVVRSGGIGGAVARLLVLALLALAAIPALAWAPPSEDHGHHAAPDHAAPDHAALDHAALDHGPHGTDAFPSPARHDADHTSDHPAGGHRDAHPALACCVAMHCPMLTGSLPGAPAAPRPPAGSPVAEPVAPRRLAGLSLLPALPPPRAA